MHDIKPERNKLVVCYDMLHDFLNLVSLKDRLHAIGKQQWSVHAYEQAGATEMLYWDAARMQIFLAILTNCSSNVVLS